MISVHKGTKLSKFWQIENQAFKVFSNIVIKTLRNEIVTSDLTKINFDLGVDVRSSFFDVWVW